jgi:phenylalanyl-tRNA synthetase beta chain
VLEVWVPSWRRDVQGEADLVEEVARIASLTKLEPKPMRRPKPGVPAPVLTRAKARARGAADDGGARLQRMRDLQLHRRGFGALFGGGDDATRLENPISSEMSHMRPALLPGLLQAAARNQARGMMDLALFEVGPRLPRR